VVAVAPVGGAFICDSFGWRANYFVIAIVGLLSVLSLMLYLPETAKHLKKFAIKSVVTDYISLCKNSTFVKYALIPNLLCLSYMAYISIAPFLFIDKLGVSMTEFAFHQGSVVASFGVVCLVVGRVQQKFGVKAPSLWGMYISAASGLGLVIISMDPSLAAKPWLITLLMNIFAISCALPYGIIFAASLEVVPELSGSASAFIMALRVLLSAVGTYLTGKFYDGTLLPIAIIVFAGIILALYLTINIFASARVCHPGQDMRSMSQ
jgi:DHA1 family bicyclomycin/chloramphenicol resistance-like MFS transporter